MADPRTPMAWQHRDLNYHQSGYQDRYGPGAEIGSSRAGPSSTSDRLSHRTDKSWRDSREHGQPHLVPYNGGYPQGNPGHYQQGPSSHHQYPPSRPTYSSGRPVSRPHSPSASSSTSSSSSSEEDSEQTGIRVPEGNMPPPHPIYGYTGYYPGHPYPQGMYPPTMKSSRSVPVLTQGTFDGEPCPVHGGGPLSLPGYPQMFPPGPVPLPPPPMIPRRSTSIYDMRMLMPPPGPIYGTLPARPPPSVIADRRSMGGSMLGPAPGAPPGIPPELLPPMARPRPMVVGESGNAEPLPVRSPLDKNGSLPPGIAAKVAAEKNSHIDKQKQGICCRGGPCVAWVILTVICLGILLAVMLRFIL